MGQLKFTNQVRGSNSIFRRSSFEFAKFLLFDNNKGCFYTD